MTRFDISWLALPAEAYPLPSIADTSADRVWTRLHQQLASWGRFLAWGVRCRSIPFFWLPLLAIVLGIRILAATSFPLFYPESRYAELSRFLSIGYVEDAPLTAWLIHLSSFSHFVDSHLSLRLSSLGLGLASYAAFSVLCWRLYRDREIAMWSCLIFLSLPIVNVVGVLAVSESALLCCFLFFLVFVWEGVDRGGTANWILAGVFLGLALLAELSAIVGLLGVGLFLALDPAHRTWLRRKEPYLAITVALLVLSPFIYWNGRNDFAGFSWQLWHQYSPHFEFPPQGVSEFFVEQVASTGVFLAIPFAATLLASSRTLPAAHRVPHLFAKVQATTVLAFFFVGSVVLETHPQTTLLAFPMLAIVAAACVSVASRATSRHRLQVCAGLTIGSLLLGGLLIVPALGVLRAMQPRTADSKWGGKVMLAQQHLFGWREVEARLSRELEVSFPDGRGRLFTHSPQLSTMVSFYYEGPPVVNLVPFVLGDHVAGASQRSYISREALAGQSGIFYAEVDGPTRTGLSKIFEDVEELAPIQLGSGQQTRRYRVYIVRRLIPSALQPD